MIFRKPPSILMLAVFALAACTSDSGDTADDATTDDAAEAPVTEAANPCDAAVNPCDGMAEAEAMPAGRAPTDEVAEAIAAFVEHDPDLQEWFDESAGYVVFPGVGKGALIVGGAHGNGEVIVGGSAVGTASLTELSIGAQAGGQDFREVIFFESDADASSFQEGGWELAGGASAVAATAGAASSASYSDGVAVFTLPKAGLMAEISVGGQKFKYEAY